MCDSRGSDIAKILAYVAGSLLLGALIAPWLYNLGKGLAEITVGKQSNAFIAWLAAECARAQFSRYFDRSVALAAAILFPPLFQWLKVGRTPVRFRDTPWSLRLPDSVVACNEGQPLRKNPRGLRDALGGFLVAVVPLIVIGMLLLANGWFQLSDACHISLTAEAWRVLAKALRLGIGVGLVEEVIFRGVLLGIFLRAMRPASALVSLSLLFALLHFLQPSGAELDHPDDMMAGFTLLRMILATFADPMVLLVKVLPMFTVGFVLGYARLRTASLWLPAGLHAGWVVGVVAFKSLTLPGANSPPGSQFFVGDSLREGIIPLAMVVATGFLVHALTNRHEQPHQDTP